MHNGTTHGGLNPTKDDFINMLIYAQENDCTIAGWNVQFDVQWLIAYGLEDEVFKCKFIDGMLLWRHLTIEPEYEATGSRKKSYGLKAAVAEFLPAFSDYELDIDFHDPSPEARAKLHEYNISDVKFTEHLTLKFYNELSKKQQTAARIEAECIPLIAAANYHGMVVDVPAVEALCAKLEQTAEQKLAELAPYGVTEEIIRSPAKLSKLLFDDWGLPPQGTTDTGARSTDKSALHELSLIDPKAKTLREYREALNNKTKFAQTILESAAYNGNSTTHPQAIIFGTYSGRLTYASNQGRGKELRQTGFAIHQMKRGAEYRAAIKAPDGFTILEFDAAGQELRWFACASKDPTMLKLCMPGQDPHAYMAKQIGPDVERQMGKLSNLSLQYRTSAKKLQQVARVQYNIPMTLKEAEHIHATYQDAYSQVPVFWKSQIAKVKHAKYVETYAGRRVSVDGDWSGNHAWSMGSTAINYRIQGTGADQKYLALAVIKPYLRQIGARFAWDLHDGIYLYVPDDKVQEAAEQIKLSLDNLPYKSAWGFEPPIPLPWDCKSGKSWGELKEYKFNEADTPDQEGASLSIAPTLQPDGVQGRERLGDLSTSNKASPQLVQVDFRPQREAALEVALQFASAGIKTFPCQADKKPAPGFMNWENAASSDPDQLRQWFLTDYRDTAAMVGMPCGPNNLVAIDPDRPKPEKGKTADGLVLFKNLVHELSIDLTGVPIIKSPSGGQHYIFSQPQDARFGCATGSLPDNVDVKGDGGYLIASGSRRADGLAYEQMPGTPSLIESFKTNTIPAMPLQLRTIIGTRKERLSAPNNETERLDWHLLAEALSPQNIPNDATFDSRDEWVSMAHAIYGASSGQDWGRKEWLAWNARRQQSPNEPERVWDTIKPAEVRAGSGYIKAQLFTRNRTELLERIANAEAGNLFTKVVGDEGQSDSPKLDDLIKGPSPFKRINAWDMPPRQFVYKKHYIRKFISASIAPGGVGKSTVAIAEAVAMATGKDILGHAVTEPLKVWYWNGEDPFDELQRRFLAVIQHFNLTNEDIELLEENLFFDSGRNLEIKIAFQEKNGTKIAAPVANKLKQWIEENEIDVVIIDPFVSSHSVSENDNNAIDVVAKAWAKIADVTNCAIDLVHHVRKTNGQEATVEDARGASALLAAVRSARVFNAMSADEAARSGVHNQKLYFKEDNGKANLAPAAAAGWYKISGVDLPNGDSVATVNVWQWPNIHDQVTDEDLVEIQRRCKADEPSESSQAADWVGHVVADVMGLNAGDKSDKARIKELLKVWLKEGNLCVKTAWNARQGKPKKVISSHT
jgi:DNA polymerase I-like protein with 3'-5' exonuclease and polymerase domains